MPFKSKAQKNYMFAKMPKMAKQWAKKTKKMPKKLDKAAEKEFFGSQYSK